jgi:Arc/MetJ family transcription regulator
MDRGVAVAVPSAIRRRKREDSRREKTSISLSAEVLAAAKKIVDAGEAENLSALVESALREKVRQTKRAALYAAYSEAARNDAFMREMNDVTREFAHTDSDGL